jgi:hypothetical protein
MQFSELPTACPKCAREFGFSNRPQRKWQVKAMAVFGAAIAITLVWGAVVLLTANSMIDRAPGGRGSIALVIGILVLIFAPGLAIAAYAAAMRKVVQLRCYSCQWKETYLVER